MISVQGVEKRYGDLIAVDQVSFEIEAGESFGLLGPNGAGKSTTIHMLAGTLTPDRGTITIDGQGIPTNPNVRRLLGVSPQELAIYDELTGIENLRFFGQLYGLRGRQLTERVAWCLDFAGLTDRGKDRISTYSGGMKRRLNLACALVHEPKILICDEPTVGVDPQSRNHIFEGIKQLSDSGMSLIYTTHYMEEAQRLCHRVAIIDHGKLLAIDTVDQLIAEHGGLAVVEAQLRDAPSASTKLPGTVDGKNLRIETNDPLQSIANLRTFDVDIHRLRVDQPDLERVFLKLTGRSLRD